MKAEQYLNQHLCKLLLNDIFALNCALIFKANGVLIVYFHIIE